MAEVESDVGIINGRTDDDVAHIEEGEIATINEAEDDTELAAGTGADGEEPTGEVRQERVVVSFMTAICYNDFNYSAIAFPERCRCAQL